MQPHRPAIAVVTPSILTGLGLESILRRIIPMAEVEVYDRFERFAADRPDRFFHYFVASQTFVEHNAFFLERRHKSILLTDGAPQSTLRELHCLDIAQSEEGLVRDILRLHQHAHREGYPDGTFGPQKQITRAEAVTLVNRTLDRHPDPDHFLEDMLVWPDNLDTKAWYYADMQEATNSHDFVTKDRVYESWTDLNRAPDWSRYE